MNRNLQDLLDIGFTKVGEWRLGSDGLTLDLKDKRDASPALYAFIVDGDVKYVGKTVRPLNKRLYGRESILINQQFIRKYARTPKLGVPTWAGHERGLPASNKISASGLKWIPA